MKNESLCAKLRCRSISYLACIIAPQKNQLDSQSERLDTVQNKLDEATKEKDRLAVYVCGRVRKINLTLCSSPVTWKVLS